MSFNAQSITSTLVKVASFWQSTSFMTKIVYIVSICLQLISFLIFSYLEYELIFSPDGKNYWALLTSVIAQSLIFLTQIVIKLIVSLYTFILNLFAINDASRIEKRIGSIYFIIEVFLKNAIIQALNLVLSLFVLSFIYKGIASQYYCGMWNPVFYMICFRALQQPGEDIQLLFFSQLINARIYAILVSLALCIFTLSLRVDLICGFLVAAFEHLVLKKPLLRIPKVFKLYIYIKPYQKYIESLEKNAFLAKYSTRQDFILVDNAQEIVMQGTKQIQFNAFKQPSGDDLEKSPEMNPQASSEEENQNQSGEIKKGKKKYDHLDQT